MALRSHSLVLFLAFIATSALFSVSNAAFGGRKSLAPAVEAPPPDDEAFVVLDTKDPQVVGLARFALDQYNKLHNVALKYVELVEAAYTHTERGVNYGFVIGASDGTGAEAGYDANVLVNKDDKTLLGFWKQTE